jgi:hypothetical protein
MQLDTQPQRQHRPMTDPEPQPSAQTPAQPRASLYVLLLSLAVDATTLRPTPPNPTAPLALMPRGQT